MNLPLDPAREQIIQREVERGHYATPAEDTEDFTEDFGAWLAANKDAISERLDLSYEQSRRGETYSPDEARRILAADRALRRQ